MRRRKERKAPSSSPSSSSPSHPPETPSDSTAHPSTSSPMKMLPQSIRIEIDTAIDDTLDEFRDKLHEIVHREMEHYIKARKDFEENAKKNKWRTDKKVFEPRETLLTTILEQDHFRTIYHIFLAFLLLYAFSTLLSDVMEGRFFIDLSLIWSTLDKLHLALAFWILLVSVTALYAWILSLTIERLRKRASIFWTVYFVYQVVFYLVPGYVTWTWKLPPGSALIVLIETIRIAMKVHAFTYEAMYSPEEKVSLGCFAYFFVAPTLVYRSKYPMTRHISWGSAFKHMMNLVFCVIYCFFLFDRFFIPHFEKYGIEEKERPLQLLYVAFECVIPGTMIFMLGFFGVLHSWFNFFAELSQFADRDFYSDWWNATNWPSYFRRWNGVVHDFIYWYLFQPFQRTFKLNRSASMAVAFLISALVHEYVMMIVFRFFFPVMFFLFAGCGLAMSFIPSYRMKSWVWNVLMWAMLMFGNGVMATMYTMEWHIRQNTNKPTDTTFIEFITPYTLKLFQIV